MPYTQPHGPWSTHEEPPHRSELELEVVARLEDDSPAHGLDVRLDRVLPAAAQGGIDRRPLEAARGVSREVSGEGGVGDGAG